MNGTCHNKAMLGRCGWATPKQPYESTTATSRRDLNEKLTRAPQMHDHDDQLGLVAAT